MGQAIAEVLPAAVAMVLVSPLPVVAVIVLLLSPKAALAPAFVAGWLLGLVVAFGILLFIVPLDDIVGTERTPSAVASIVRILLGLALLVMAVRKWRDRPKPGSESAPPTWMASLERASPLAALGLAALLSGANPKTLVFIVATAIAVAQPHLAPGERLVSLVVFVLLASVGVVAPALWMLVARDRASVSLAGWKTWLTANYA
ncbi:MAG: GAP family protein, partial [Thermomicrobiales bacterium]|nr:GAP family protein [Thermomicrobiales bacterium]